MIKKLVVAMLAGAICLMGVAPGLAQKIYTTLAEYEKLTGKKIEKFSEAPSLKTRVAAAELPPVEERLPEEPMVMEPLEEIGQYGGVIRGGATSPIHGGNDLSDSRGQFLFVLWPDLKTITPNIAKDWDLSKDYKSLTVYLREGMKWSDGAPFSADDVMFWYNDIILNDELTPVKPKVWSPGGELVKVEKINDYTVRFQFAAPYPPIVGRLAFGNNPFAPEHYLKQYHIKYNPEANETAKKEKYDYWWQCFNFHNLGGDQQQDVMSPTLNIWALKKIDSYGNKYFERNPFYWKVDPAGNQLPYVDMQARILVENVQVLNLKAIAGEFDVAGLNLSLENYPLYKGGEEKGNYRALLWDNPWGNAGLFHLNFTHKDPVLRKLFNNARVVRAMSLTINRQEINEVCFFGKGVPRQATAHPSVSFYEDWMGKYYAEYDPKEANRLLDEVGLKWDKDHEYRLRPDGKTLALTIDYVEIEGPKGRITELVKEYWERIGFKVAIKEMERGLYSKRGLANEHDVCVWHLDTATEPGMWINPIKFYPVWSGWGNPKSGKPWLDWYRTDGKAGEEPPKQIKRLFKAVEEFQATLPGTEEYMRLGKEILTINLENLYLIGTVGLSPKCVIINKDLRNTPERGMFGWDHRFFMPYQSDQWFFKK